MQAGDATMMEYDANQKLNYKRQTYAPTTFGSKTITTTQTKRSTYAKEFLSTYFWAQSTLGTICGEAHSKLNCSPTTDQYQFLRAKFNPPALWNSSGYVLQ